MVLSFRYKDVPRSNGTRAKSPSIPVTLSGKGNPYSFTALIDSGGDISAVPKSVAELLDLDFKDKKVEKAFGIGGAASAVETHMCIEFGKGHERHKFIVPVKVILDNYDFPPLIGRAEFFDKFDITFKQSEKKIILKFINAQRY